MRSTINLYNSDCLPAMRKMADNQYDLAIVDPNYGIGEDGKKNHSRGKLAKPTLYDIKEWDKNSVDKIILDEILRVSKNQIIWGANHFISKMPFDSSCWIIWDKENGENDFADCELAWTSFDTAVRKFTFRWAGMLQGNMKHKETRIHPTQKPVALYKWLLKNYAKPGYKIIDTHFGSLSIGIACWDAGYDLDAYEIDRDYFETGKKRLENHKAQLQLY